MVVIYRFVRFFESSLQLPFCRSTNYAFLKSAGFLRFSPLFLSSCGKKEERDAKEIVILVIVVDPLVWSVVFHISGHLTECNHWINVYHNLKRVVGGKPRGGVYRIDELVFIVRCFD